MRIATITSGPPSGLAGTERFLGTLSGVLRQTGAELEHFHFGQLRPPRRWSPWDRMGLHLAGHAAVLARRALANHPPFDLYIAHGLCGWALPPERTVVIYHGCYAAYADAVRERLSPRGRVTMKAIWGRAERWASRARTLIALSRESAGQLARYYGIRRPRIILNAVDLDYYRPAGAAEKQALRRELGLPETGCVALFAGAWNYPKGADIIAAAAEQLPPDVTVMAASYADPSDVDVPSRVRLFLRQSAPEMLRLYRASDLFFFPSRGEACSLALAEAMACGLAPVASRAGAWQEIVAGAPDLSPCFLPQGSTAADYAQAIARLAADPSAKEAMGDAAARAARDLFNPARFGAEYRGLVAGALRAL